MKFNDILKISINDTYFTLLMTSLSKRFRTDQFFSRTIISVFLVTIVVIANAVLLLWKRVGHNRILSLFLSHLNISVCSFKYICLDDTRPAYFKLIVRCI